MPYIITTKRPLAGNQTLDEAMENDDVTAVATLDEARAHLRPILADAFPHGPVGNRAAVRDLPESGGTIGPLPDGTVIEVQQVTWARLTHDAGLPVWHLTVPPLPKRAEQFVAAFNAR